ncbi:sporulation protein YpjB [Bacillus salitolerans]|uniref:Sporulation protein YpjB n=1 Tax=Bacillus salitolerans TaxID=1437434 RepID=A0ABW4LTS9_9BACI
MKKMMMILAIIFAIMPSVSHANHTHNWEDLDIVADQALQLVKQQKYEDASKLLSYFSDQFSKLLSHESMLSMDELRIITATYEDASLALTTISMPHEERVQSVTTFRLVVDAIESEHQPLWTEMEGSVMTTFQSMKEAVSEGNSQHFNHQLNEFLGKYQMIYPSVRLDLEAEDSQRIDSFVTFLDKYRGEFLTNDSKMDHMNVIEEELTRMFKQMKKDDADPSLIWVMISTGSAIILTLTYVGWRKYKGDKEKHAARKRLND